MTDNRRLLELALKGLVLEREAIDREIAGITAQMTDGSESSEESEPVETPAPAVVAAPEAPKTAAAAVPAASAAPAKRERRKLSAAGRKAIIEATKRRWAEYRKTQAKGSK